jgi:hypothetical protein
LAGQDGRIGIRGGDGSEVDVELEDILKNLEFGFMAVAEVGKGPWSFWIDGMFVNLSWDSLGTSDRSEVEARQVTLDGAVTFHFRDPEFLNLYAGARYNNLSAKINREDESLAIDNHAIVDPIIGVRLRWDFASGWTVGGRGDIGGFGVSSSFTWQVVPTVGYRVSRTAAVLLAYRYLSIDYEDESWGFLYDVNTAGLALGVELAF